MVMRWRVLKGPDGHYTPRHEHKHVNTRLEPAVGVYVRVCVRETFLS